MGWPDDGKLLIRALAKPADGRGNSIRRIALLGMGEKPVWNQSAEGLEVTLPAKQVSSYTAALKIEGDDLLPVPVTPTP